MWTLDTSFPVTADVGCNVFDVLPHTYLVVNFEHSLT